MKRQLKKNEKVQIGLLALACAIILLGILFLVNAMQEDPANGFFPAFCEMDNIIAKYIVVIITMACGIMLFSNVAITVEDRKLRNGLTIGITAFSTVLTVPLVLRGVVRRRRAYVGGVCGDAASLAGVHHLPPSHRHYGGEKRADAGVQKERFPLRGHYAARGRKAEGGSGGRRGRGA